MLALALPHGVTIRIHAQGPQREAVADAIATLIASGMNEGAPFETSTGTLPTAPLPSTLRGVVAAPGFAIGPAWHLRQATIAVPMVGAGLDHERTALRNALDALRTSLAGNVWVDDDVAAIADARLAFLADPELIAAAEAGISVGQSAGQAWRTVIGGFVAALQRAADKRFAERIADLRDLEYQLLGELYGRTEEVAAPAGAILVAAELLSSQLMALAGKGIAGVATGGGGPTSHVAIIAAGMGLPMLVALGDDVERIAGGAMLLLDSEAATLAIDPPAALLSERRAAAAEAARFRSEAQLRAHEPALTIDGTRIELFANLGSVEDARVAVDAGAEGCGLLRTEFLFLDRPTAPSEEEQRATCQAIADALGDCPLIVRTLDIGADKPAPYLPLPPEENPALGLRGLRLGLSRPELLRGQLRALLRVKGPVRIMLPMVVEPGEVAQVREMLHEIATEIGRDAPPLGIMVETPAAAMLAGPLARVADFFSIGSNDLTQYALAMDRGNPAVAARADGLHPAVLRLIAATVEGARTADRWTGVCGGIAADPLAVPILIGLGITELSVPPAMVAETKARVRRTSMVACRALAVEVLKMDKATDVRARVRHFIEEGQGA
jgi:phosphocarrier protein FPr/phosphocarrier protein